MRTVFKHIFIVLITVKFLRNKTLFKLIYWFIRLELKCLYILKECLLKASQRTIASSRLSVFLHINSIQRFIVISIQPEGRFWQEPEPSQAIGMALAHCILGSFLGVGCHCFPPPLDVPPFASR